MRRKNAQIDLAPAGDLVEVDAMGALKEWRTILLCALGIVALVVGLWLCPRESRALAYGSTALAVVGIVSAGAAKRAVESSVEKLAGGGGLEGAKRALMTDEVPRT
jgi:hypothetical protein